MRQEEALRLAMIAYDEHALKRTKRSSSSRQSENLSTTTATM